MPCDPSDPDYKEENDNSPEKPIGPSELSEAHSKPAIQKSSEAFGL